MGNNKNNIKNLFFFKKILIVIQLQLYAFSPHPSTPLQLNPPKNLFLWNNGKIW